MERLKKSTQANVLVSIVFIILGLMLAFKPDVTFSLIVNIIGGIIILFGVVKIFNYLKLKKEFNMFEYDLFFGILGIILGIVVIVFGREVASLFRVIIVIWIIYNAVLKMQVSLYLKRGLSHAWSYTMIGACLMLVCGLFITFKSNAIISTVGIVVIIYAVMDLIENLITLKNFKNIYIQK